MPPPLTNPTRGNADLNVAVLYSGWLNVSTPESGATAFRHLIAPWRADVLVAATYKDGECSSEACLSRVLAGLGPLRAVRLDRMLSIAALRRLVSTWPMWSELMERYHYSGIFHSKGMSGIHWAAPVVGDNKLSVLRQIHDYSRVYALLQATEGSRGRRYARVIHSRLEFHWLAAHPPPRMLAPAVDLIWVPSGESYAGVNDRHAVMGREVRRATELAGPCNVPLSLRASLTEAA